MYKKAKISLITLLIPAISFAAGPTLKNFLGVMGGYLDTALKLLMGLAVVAFVFSIIRYFIVPNSGENRKEAGNYVLWSIIGFFVIAAMWGIVNILLTTFDLGNTAPSMGSLLVQ